MSFCLMCVDVGWATEAIHTICTSYPTLLCQQTVMKMLKLV